MPSSQRIYCKSGTFHILNSYRIYTGSRFPISALFGNCMSSFAKSCSVSQQIIRKTSVHQISFLSISALVGAFSIVETVLDLLVSPGEETLRNGPFEAWVAVGAFSAEESPLPEFSFWIAVWSVFPWGWLSSSSSSWSGFWSCMVREAARVAWLWNFSFSVMITRGRMSLKLQES